MPTKPPQLADPSDRDDLPHALTFFFTSGERREVLRALRRRHTTRTRALMIALRLERPVKARKPKGTR